MHGSVLAAMAFIDKHKDILAHIPQVALNTRFELIDDGRNDRLFGPQVGWRGPARCRLDVAPYRSGQISCKSDRRIHAVSDEHDLVIRPGFPRAMAFDKHYIVSDFPLPCVCQTTATSTRPSLSCCCIRSNAFLTVKKLLYRATFFPLRRTK